MSWFQELERLPSLMLVGVVVPGEGIVYVCTGVGLVPSYSRTRTAGAIALGWSARTNTRR